MRAVRYCPLCSPLPPSRALGAVPGPGAATGRLTDVCCGIEMGGDAADQGLWRHCTSLK